MDESNKNNTKQPYQRPTIAVILGLGETQGKAPYGTGLPASAKKYHRGSVNESAPTVPGPNTTYAPS